MNLSKITANWTLRRNPEPKGGLFRPPARGKGRSGTSRRRPRFGGHIFGLPLLLILAAVTVPMLLLLPTVMAQAGSVDYDADDDGLIEIDSLAQLNAIRWDLDGDGAVAPARQTSYDAAFPNAIRGMGCPLVDHDDDPATAMRPHCAGYELEADLSFDENGDNTIDSSDATYWNNGLGWEPLGDIDMSAVNDRLNKFSKITVPFSLDYAVTSFTATFDGNNHTIDHLYVYRPSEDFVGLFRQFNTPAGLEDSSPTSLKNLNLINVKVTGRDWVGAAVGMNLRTEIVNVTGQGTVSGDDGVGGLIGRNGCHLCALGIAVIEGCSFSGSVIGVNQATGVESETWYGFDTGSYWIGGLAGTNQHLINNSSSAADVAGYSMVGGLAGTHGLSSLRIRANKDLSKIANSHATGSVTATGKYAGGLAGSMSVASVHNSYAVGNVTANSDVGGLVGLSANGSTVRYSYATGAVNGTVGPGGGLAGVIEKDSTIAASYAVGTVTAQRAGGLAGDNYGLIQDSYSSGTVTGTQYAGGFIGHNRDKARVLRSYSSGAVSVSASGLTTNQPYGFIAMNSSRAKVLRSFWDTTTSGQTASAAGAGKTTSELKSPAGYSGPYAHWRSADLVWDFGAASQYPALKADLDGDGIATAAEFGNQGRSARTAAPVNVSVNLRANGSGTRVVWESSPAAGEDTTYQVRRRLDAPDASYQLIATGIVDNNADGLFKYRDESDDLEAGKTYAYSVGAFDGDGSLLAQWTEGVSIQLPANDPPPTAQTAGDSTPQERSAEPSQAVQGTNRAPAFADASLTRSVTENTAAGTAIGNAITATDPDGDSLTYSLGSTDDDGHFAIDSASGQLSTKGALDYESDASYTVTVTATDDDGLTASVPVTITVTDVNEGQPASVRVNLRANGSGTRVVWEASDAVGEGVTYQVRRRLEAPDANYQVIASGIIDNNGDGLFKHRDESDDLEAGKTYTYSVGAFDGDGNLLDDWTDGVSIELPAAPNRAPAFADSSVELSVAENTAAGTAIGDAITAADPDGDALTYSLGATDDDGHFAIDSASGQLSTKGALDYESDASYTVTVTANDGHGLTASVSVTITVTGVNEAPAFADSSVEVSVAENTAAGTAIGDAITAADPDGDALTYSLGATDDDGHFAIDSASGQLSTKGALDYESDASYTVTVTANGGGGLTASASVTITVTDVNEAPAFADSSVEVSVAENTAAGTAIGNAITATDPDEDALTYSLGATDDDGHFAIDSATGQLSTKGALDYESDTSYTVTVTATDGGGLTASASVTITVTDVNEGQPVNVSVNLRANGSGTRVVWKSSPAAGEDTTYQVRRRPEGPDASGQVIASGIVDNNGDGVIKYRDESDDLEAGKTYTYSVGAFDGDGNLLDGWTDGVSIELPSAQAGESAERQQRKSAPAAAQSAPAPAQPNYQVSKERLILNGLPRDLVMWEQVPGAARYVAHWYVYALGPWYMLAASAGNLPTVAVNRGVIPEFDYQYRITAYDAADNVLAVMSTGPGMDYPDREALVAFYNATGGTGWTDNTNWLSDSPIGEWYGVATDETGRVTDLVLTGNKLTGQLPGALGDLSNMEGLYLNSNNLKGGLPPELGSLSKLMELELSDNKLTGEIPEELGNLSRLELFGLNNNYLTGAIPEELGSLDSLLWLWLSDNELTGAIPEELGSLDNLKGLYLHINELTGEIPSELGRLANLQNLDLDHNKLTGAIPPELGNLNSLQQLYLEGNSFTGCLPSAWENANFDVTDLPKLELPSCD